MSKSSESVSRITTSSRLVLWIAITLLPVAFVPGAKAQTIPWKAVWYQPSRQSLFAELADTLLPPGTTKTPRQAAIDSVDQNFNNIRNSLGANAVVIILGDDDGLHSQYGGGFPYDPHNRPAPQKAVGQEIVLAIANKYGLKVIFEVNFSGYHIWVDDLYGSNPPPPETAGAYNYIHALIDPSAYYGNPCTTDLGRVGLTNSCVRTYFDDPRVAGWLFGGEWCVSTDCDDGTGYQPRIWERERFFINQYWPFFHLLVHWNGSQNGFAGIYAFARPDSLIQDRVVALKEMFASGTGNPMPDQIGFEWYGNQGYNLANVSNDLRMLGSWLMFNGSYDIPPSKILIAEGGSNQASSPAKDQFYTDAINTAATIDWSNPVATIGVWNSDAYNNVNSCSGSGFDPNQDAWSVFNQTWNPSACVNYPPPSVGWHWKCGTGPENPFTAPWSWCLETTSFNAKYGTLTFATLRSFGTSTANAFASH